MKNLRARLFLLIQTSSAGFLLSLALLLSCSTAQALTLKDLLVLSRQQIGDSPYYASTPKVTNARLISYLNEGQRYAAAYSWAFTKRVSIDLIDGTTEYAVPADFETARRVTFDDGALPETTLAELDKEGAKWVRTTGRPYAYYIRTTTYTVIGFNPAATVTTTATVVMDYISHVNDLNEMTDVPFNGVTEYFPLHDALVKFVAYRYYLLSGNTAMANIFAAEFASDVKRLDAVTTLKPNYKPGFSSDRAR